MSLFRDFFLALSTHARLRQLVTTFPLSRRVARRFVAGETLDEAIRVVEKLNAQNLDVTFDVLGESVTNETEARAAKDEYLRALDAIAAHRVRSHVSVKLTQMGLDLSHDLCLKNMREIVSKARALGSFARIDMEDSRHTQATLNVYKTLREEFDNVGIVIQAYLYRSEQDVNALVAMNARVRLCKGAYKESPEIAFPDKRDVDANYVKLAQLFLEANGARARAHLALATHDEKIIRWARAWIAQNNVPRERYEFQMLYGIRSDLQRKLAAENYPVRVYVPYGTHWYPYFMRRLAERPANVVFLISNLFR